MKNIYLRLCVIIILAILSLSHSGTCNAETASTTIDSTYAEIYILYPTGKNNLSYGVFFNRKYITQISNGGRLKYQMTSKGIITITLINGTTYTEPRTLSKNTRNITIQPGKAYYFEIGIRGDLNYFMNPETGKTQYMEDRNFISQPVTLSENSQDPIPNLSANK